MMLNNYNSATPPGTFTMVEYVSGFGDSNFRSARASLYGVSGTPTVWFDGSLSVVGAGSTSSAYTNYMTAYNSRMATATDVSILLGGTQVEGQTYQITAQVCIDAGGTAKTLRVYMVQVLDYWPGTAHTPRYGFVQSATVHASPDIVAVSPGGCASVTHNFTFTGDSWTNQEDIKIVAWAATNTSPYKTIYQAATLHWPFEPPKIPGDLNGDLVVDPNDIPPWALAMTNRAQFELQYPNVDLDVVGDTNDDGHVDGRDTYTFVNLLINDITPPTPNPMSFATVPYPVSTSAVSMVATEATDSSGVEYYFKPSAQSNGATDSGWQASRTYTDDGLQTNRNYSYTIKARDLSPQHNETSASTSAMVATFIETPTGLVTGAVTNSSIEVTAQPTFTRLTAAQSGAYYEVTDLGGTPVGGATANTWVQLQTITATGLSPDTTYRFRVRARNYYGANITPWYPESGYIEITTAP